VRKTVKIGKRGTSLAFRIPKAIVEQFNIKVGDAIDSKHIERAIIQSRLELENEQR
jgi:antitoxin component of MazEF toxin-antitoxin module